MSDTILDTARKYVRAGLSVLACAADKKPAVGGSWKAFQTTAASEVELQRWFSTGDRSIALVCGAVSGGLELIDFDYQGEWYSPWADVVNARVPGLLQRLVIEKSQSGGVHVCYRLGADVPVAGNTKLAAAVKVVPAAGTHLYRSIGKPVKAQECGDGAWRIFPGLIETRGEGGYFLCAPSPRYELLQGSFEALPLITPAEHVVLMECARSLDLAGPFKRELHSGGHLTSDRAVQNNSPKATPLFSASRSPASGDAHAGGAGGSGAGSAGPVGSDGPLPSGRGSLARSPAGGGKGGENEAPGERYNKSGAVLDLLRAEGWTFVKKNASGNEEWCRPGKKGECGATFNGTSFYVWTSNAPPFEPSASYSPFAVYALLKHGGDMSAAARVLRREYGGSFGPAPVPPPGMDSSGRFRDVDEFGGESCDQNSNGGSAITSPEMGETFSSSTLSTDAITDVNSPTCHGSETESEIAAEQPAPEAVKSANELAMAWLKDGYPELLGKVVGMAVGVERLEAANGLFVEIVRRLQGVSPLVSGQIKTEICEKLKIGKRDYDAQIRAAAEGLRETAFVPHAENGGARAYARSFKAVCESRRRFLIRWRETWYEWTRQTYCYREVTPEGMRKEAWDFLEYKVNVSSEVVGNFLEALKSLVFLKDNIEAPCWIANVDGKIRRQNSIYIPMLNGILDLQSITFEMRAPVGPVDEPGALDGAEVETMKHWPLITHTPDFFTLNALPYAFDSTAVCPMWQDALQTWQPEDKARDAQNLRIEALQNWAGYIFMPGQRFERILLNIGPGGDGKSQFNNVMQALVGDENCTGVGLEGFDPKNKHGLESLIGSMLNVVADANKVERMTTGTLKQISSGDKTNVSRMYKTARQMRLGCKLMISANEMPSFNDQSNGIWRRLVILFWDTIPANKVKVEFSVNLITTEMPGIFNWAMRGFYRLMQTGRFEAMGVLKENVYEAKTMIQHELEFFDECMDLLIKDEGVVYMDEIVAEYKSFCVRKNNSIFCKANTLGTALHKWARERVVKTANDHKRAIEDSGFGAVIDYAMHVAEGREDQAEYGTSLAEEIDASIVRAEPIGLQDFMKGFKKREGRHGEQRREYYAKVRLLKPPQKDDE